MKSLKKSNLVKKLSLNKSTITGLTKNDGKSIKAGIADQKQILTLQEVPGPQQNTC
ncbi:MAG: hypothetical protein GY757_57430 [bacterium]|nr:hypothetical protein [bacterium]